MEPAPYTCSFGSVATASAAPARTPTAASATPIRAAAATTAARTPAATATTAFARWPRFVHNYASPHEVMPVQRLNGAPGIVVAIHFHEAESPRLTREAIPHQSDVRR